MCLKKLRDSIDWPAEERSRVRFLTEFPTPALSPVFMGPWASIMFSEPQLPLSARLGMKISFHKTVERVKWGKMCVVPHHTPDAWICQHAPLHLSTLPTCLPSTSTSYSLSLLPNFLFPTSSSLIRPFLLKEKELMKTKPKICIKLRKTTSMQHFSCRVCMFKCLIFLVCILWRVRIWGWQCWSGGGLWKIQARGEQRRKVWHLSQELSILESLILPRGIASTGSVVPGQAKGASNKPP